jgi:hypothetical protein
MTTLAEIESAVVGLPKEQQIELYRFLQNELQSRVPKQSVLDIPPVSLGGLLDPLTGDKDDLLDEMLGERA